MSSTNGSVRYKAIVLVEIEGAPEEEFEEPVEPDAEDASKDRRSKKVGIHVLSALMMVFISRRRA